MDFFEVVQQRRAVREYRLAETKTELAIPADYHVVAPIVLGFPKGLDQRSSFGASPVIHTLMLYVIGA